MNAVTLRREMGIFISALALIGFGESITNAVFNNFLNETFTITSLQRTFLEFPRELPGFLVVFVSALLFFIRTRRLAVTAALIGSAGLVLLAFFSSSFGAMAAWLFIFSLGQHLFMPLSTSIGMELATEGKTGKRLGQLNAVRNISMIAGSFAMALAFRHLGFTFRYAFLTAALFYAAAAFFLFKLDPGVSHKPKVHLKLQQEYRLYYWLSVLFGTRKQIFLTFAPWVLVTVYNKPIATIATLLTIAGICGVLFQPLLGKAIDVLGEKKVLSLEAILLVFVCLGYGLSKSFFSPSASFLIASCCFIADQLLMSVNMARSTYLKKIALDPTHITPALTMSITIDHIFSIGVAIAGGVLWTTLGYQSVFIAGAGIALVNLISVQFISIPSQVR